MLMCITGLRSWQIGFRSLLFSLSLARFHFMSGSSIFKAPMLQSWLKPRTKYSNPGYSCTLPALYARLKCALHMSLSCFLYFSQDGSRDTLMSKRYLRWCVLSHDLPVSFSTACVEVMPTTTLHLFRRTFPRLFGGLVLKEICGLYISRIILAWFDFVGLN